MEISEDNIKLIIRLISEKLGPNTSAEKISSLAAEVIGHLTSVEVKPEADKIPKTIESPKEIKKVRLQRLIINAFGPAQDGLEERLRTLLVSKDLTLTAFSSVVIEEFKSTIAIIDYTDYKSDLNLLKFELSELCEKFGLKAIVQNNAYYGLI